MERKNERSDIVAVIEATYRIEPDETQWLDGIVRSARSWLDGDEAGVCGFTYSTSDSGVVPRTIVTQGSAARLQETIELALRNPATTVSPRVMERDFAAISEFPRWRGSEGARLAAHVGIRDFWGFNGRNWQGTGAAIVVGKSQSSRVPASVTTMFRQLSTHLAAAYRLRGRLLASDYLARAEAILRPDGALEHATGAARERNAKGYLRRAVIAQGNARTSLRRSHAHAAVAAWKGAVAARWTLVDYFERDGRRYILAQENDPTANRRGNAGLSSRERQVLQHSALGRSNKEIAYAMGIAHATVRVLFARAAQKLGAASRAETIQRFVRSDSQA